MIYDGQYCSCHAGFGYVFNSLNSLHDPTVEQNELARAFGVIFSTARKFRVITILQVWFPILRKFVRVVYLAPRAYG